MMLLIHHSHLGLSLFLMTIHPPLPIISFFLLLHSQAFIAVFYLSFINTVASVYLLMLGFCSPLIYILVEHLVFSGSLSLVTLPCLFIFSIHFCLYPDNWISEIILNIRISFLDKSGFPSLRKLISV